MHKNHNSCIFIAPLWKRGGGAILDYGCLAFCPSVRSSVCPTYFVSAQYLEKYFIEFNQILYVHLYWHDLSWDCYTSFFEHLYQSCGPWFTPKFPLNILNTTWQIFTKFYIYSFILTRSRLGLFYLIFQKFVPELWPII